MAWNRSKGSRIEKRAIEALASFGYTCWKPAPSVAFIRGRPITVSADVFGVFDVIAIPHLDSPVLFVQVTHYRNATNRKRKVESLIEQVGEWFWKHARVFAWRGRGESAKQKKPHFVVYAQERQRIGEIVLDRGVWRVIGRPIPSIALADPRDSRDPEQEA